MTEFSKEYIKEIADRIRSGEGYSAAWGAHVIPVALGCGTHSYIAISGLELRTNGIDKLEVVVDAKLRSWARELAKCAQEMPSAAISSMSSEPDRIASITRSMCK